MGSSSSTNFCFFLLSAVSLLITKSCHGYSYDHDGALFIFGDSLHDAGNNNYLQSSFKANFPPYGETFFKYPTGRASNGRLIPDFIAEYAKLPLALPYLQPGNNQYVNGVNFASMGAGALVDTFAALQVISLPTQLSYFKKVAKQLRQKLGDIEAEQVLSKAVYMFSIGGNDYFAALSPNSTIFQSYSRKEYVMMVMGNITTVIQEIYKTGGRKFGFSNLINLGCLPMQRANALESTGRSGCFKETTLLAKLHNRALPKTLKELERQLEGYKYSNFDMYKAANERLDNPSEYGLMVVDEACCGSGPYRGTIGTCGNKTMQYQLCHNVDKYYFFDEAHPTEEVNYQLANLMWSGSTQYVSPYNLKTLFE